MKFIKLWQNFLLLAVGIAVAIFISEVTLSILEIPKFYKPHTYPSQFEFYSSKDSKIYYLNKSSANIQFIYDGNPRGYFGPENEVNHYTNSWGFRGKEFGYEKSEFTFRTAFFGDSFTFGEGVRSEDIYSEKTIELLKDKYNCAECSFEGYNFGVGGYNITQSLFLFKSMVLKTHPDVVVLGYALNDAEPNLFYVDSFAKTIVRNPRENNIPEGLSDPLPPENVIFKLRTARLAWKIFKQEEISKGTEKYYNSLYSPDNPNWIQTQNSLKEFIMICQEEKVHCYILLFPLLYKLNDNYPFKHIHELVKREVLSNNKYIHFIDLYDYLKGRDYLSLWVHPNDQHPNEIVHKVAAQALFNAISTNPEIDKRLKGLKD